ncbi:MAG: AAA family ATPase, partial [Oscillospiraceae bacterium]|nr:AAA family ATPase [Oscillospiraceae bacterium]
MRPTICTKCGKNVAIIFLRKNVNGVISDEGLCLKCARDMNIKPIEDTIRGMGLSDEDMDTLSEEMTEMLGNMPSPDEMPPDEDEGKTATFPFLNRLFSPPPENMPQNNGGGIPTPRGEFIPQPWRDGRGGDGRGESGGKKRRYLDNYSLSLTARAREGKLDRMIGRESELERVVQILNRRQKNNPCLIGEPGVGKTAIAEGLASLIAAGNVPFKLRSKEVHMLDLTALVAGTQFRGQFESRMKGLIEEVKEAGNVILVIDEVHNLVGAGDAEGSMSAANILKPALS